MSKNFLHELLKNRGFSNDVYKAVEENAKRDSEEKEAMDREKALGLTLKMINEMMPSLRQAIDAEEKRKANMKTIIIPDEK
jgi:hypothetical protein